MMAARKAKRQHYDAVEHLQRAGMAREDGERLLRIAARLRRWFEWECGNDRGGIERREDGSLWLYRSSDGNWSRYHGPDHETNSRKRLAEIMARYPTLGHYVQGDPRGCALYILRPGDVPAGENADAHYSRGIAVYRE